MARYDYEYGYGSEFGGTERGRRYGAGRRFGGLFGRGGREEWRGYGEEPYYRGREEEGEYGQHFRKSRWQTDYGDPFRDRERGTPFRMMPGGWGEYAREYTRYGREFRGTRGEEGRGYGLEGRGYGRERMWGGYGRGYGREFRSRRWRY